MRRLDGLLFVAWALVPLALTAPAWLNTRAALASFGDLFAYHYPLRHLVASALQEGRLPFWNPYIFSGLPLQANSQAVLFYPVSLLGDILPLSLALTWDYLFHWIWSGLGLVLLARRNGLDALGGLFLATVFCFSPFLVYRITEGIPTLLASLSWVPWCWLALGSGRPGLLAAAWALQFLSGHPQFLVINALGMAAWIAISPKRYPLIPRFFLAGTAALALAAVQIFPTWEFIRESLRRDWLPAFTTAYSIDAATLATWLDPNALGNPLEKTFADVPSVFFETCGVYIGIVGLAAAGLGLWRGSRGGLLLIGLGLFFGLGGHNPLYREALRLTPLGYLRTPARYALLCLWGLVLACGTCARAAARLPRAARLVALLAALVQLALWDRRFLSVEATSRYLGVNPTIAREAGGQALRVMTASELANPNKTMLYRAMNVSGYEAFFLRGYPLYAARAEGRPAADASRTYLSRYDAPGWSRAGVAYYIASTGELRESPEAKPLAYFEDSATPSPALVIERPERWLISGQAPGPAKLILAQPLYPGWRAWLDGRAVRPERWDGFFQAVTLPEPGVSGGSGLPEPGVSGARDYFELRLDFKPTAWALWSALAGLSWLMWLAWLTRLAGRSRA